MIHLDRFRYWLVCVFNGVGGSPQVSDHIYAQCHRLHIFYYDSNITIFHL
jgi:hypothetical protein